MTRHEIRERLEGLAREWSEEADTLLPSYNDPEAREASELCQGQLSVCANALTSLLSEMGDGWIETATNPPSLESYPDTIDDAPVLAWDARCEEVIKKHAVYVRAYPGSYPYWQPLPEGPKR